MPARPPVALPASSPPNPSPTSPTLPPSAMCRGAGRAGGDVGARVRRAGSEPPRLPPGDPLALPGEPEEDAGLQRLTRFPADDAIRAGQLDLEQLRGPAGERVDGDLDAGRERAADELAPLAHRVEVGRRAEVDNDGGPAVQGSGGNGVHDPVAAHLLRIVHSHPHARLHSRLPVYRWAVAVVPARHPP